MTSRPDKSNTKTIALLGTTLALALFSGCEQTTSDTPTTGFVMKPESLAGEETLLHMEDEREPNLSELKRYLTHNQPKVRARALLAVGRLRTNELLDNVRALLKDADESVRTSAVFALGQLGEPTSADDLDALLAAETSPHVRAEAVLARSLLGGKTPPASILDALGSGADESVAGEACLALARYGDESTAPYAVPWLRAASPDTRWKAAYALYRLRAEGAWLASMLADPEPRVRAFAALGVGATGEAAAGPYLITMLDDASVDVVAAAAEALGELRDPNAATALETLASNPIARRRFAAMHALARSGLAEAKLRQMLEDPSPWVRALAVDGLNVAKAPTSTFRQAVKDDHWQVRVAAARALTTRGDTATLWQQMQYDPDPRVVPRVLEGLAELRDPKLGTLLLKHLGDKDPVIRATAARLIVGRGVGKAKDGLVAAYDASRSDDLLVGKMAIVEALARTPGGEDRLNPIKQAAIDPNWALRVRGYELLKQIGVAESMEPPRRVGTLRSQRYYADLAARGDYEYHATFNTEEGPVVFRLYPKTAALHMAFLEEIANSGYYADQPFSSLAPSLELRGGDDRGDGNGQFIAWARDEPGLQRFTGAQLSLSRSLGRDTACSQLRVSFLPRPDLDGRDTPLGEVLSGADVLDRIAPGTAIRSVQITSHEFKGTMVREVVRLDLPTTPTPGPATAAPGDGSAVATTAPTRQPWQRPPALLYIAILGAAMLLASLAPLAVSKEKREDIPLAVWIIVALTLVVAGGMTYLIFTGGYFQLLTSEAPGPRKLGIPNPPVMSDEDANLVSLGAQGFLVLEIALLFFFTSGRPFARWLFLFLFLVEIALFTAQLATGLVTLYIISHSVNAINVLKIWFLLMDRRTKEFFAGGS